MSTTEQVQLFYKIYYKSGDEARVPFGPLELYEAAEAGNISNLGLSYGAAWVAAGKPEGDIRKWLAGVARVVEEEETVPLKGGSKR